MGKITPLLNGLELIGCVVYPIYYGFPGAFYKSGIRAKIKAPILLNDSIFAEEKQRISCFGKNLVYSTENPSINFEPLSEMIEIEVVEPLLQFNLDLFGADTPTCITSYKNIGLGIRLAFFVDGLIQVEITMKSKRKIYPCVSFGHASREKTFIGMGEKSLINMKVGAFPNRKESQTVFSARKLDIYFKHFYPDSWCK